MEMKISLMLLNIAFLSIPSICMDMMSLEPINPMRCMLTDYHYEYALSLTHHHGDFSNAVSSILDLSHNDTTWNTILKNPNSTGKLITYIYEYHEKRYIDNTKGEMAFALGTKGAREWFRNNFDEHSLDYKILANIFLNNVKSGNVHCAKVLLKMGVNPDTAGQENLENRPAVRKLSYNPALITAVLNNDYRMVTLLLRYGANPNIQDRVGNTALVYACHLNDIPVVQELLKDDRVDITIRSYGGLPASHVMYINSHISQLLLAYQLRQMAKDSK